MILRAEKIDGLGAEERGGVREGQEGPVSYLNPKTGESARDTLPGKYARGMTDMLCAADLVEDDALETGRAPLPPRAHMCSCVHVSRAAFLADLRRSFVSEALLRRQVEVDAPRCYLEVEGVRCLAVPDLPPALLGVCTQAYVVVLLFRRRRGVETKRRLRVSVAADGTFVAQKVLRIPSQDDKRKDELREAPGLVEVCVLVIGEADDVRIEYHCI